MSPYFIALLLYVDDEYVVNLKDVIVKSLSW